MQTYCVSAKRVYGLSSSVSTVGLPGLPDTLPYAPWYSGRPEISEPRSSDATAIRVIFLDCTALAGRLYHNGRSKGQFQSILVLSPGATLPHTQTTRHSPTKVQHPFSSPINPTTRTKQDHPSTLIRSHPTTFGLSNVYRRRRRHHLSNVGKRAISPTRYRPLHENVVGRLSNLLIFRTLHLSRGVYLHLGIDVRVLGPRHAKATSRLGVKHDDA